MPTSEPYAGTQSVLRALNLLKAFTDDQPQRGLTELARAARLNKTTTYRLLTALESEGLVVRDANGENYRLGPEAIALGGRALRANSLHSAARAELEALAQATGETATLEVLMDGRVEAAADLLVLILDEALGHHLVGTTPSVGSSWPAHTTSTGKAMLADWFHAKSESERRAALKKALPRLTDHTITSPDALRRELARIREQGFATAVEELEAGYVAVGAPIRNHEGATVAAISVGGPSTRLTADRIPDLARLVMEAAGRISSRLGHGA